MRNPFLTEEPFFDNLYTVLFQVPDKKPYKDTIPASNLRGNTPQIISDIEKEYFKLNH